MQDIIHLLPDSVANQIAAGEVVQRPASIVKEMVENSIDAGADDITVLITEGGKTCVQVVDNGCGMSETDARMAFERHATSKIKNAQDIYSLHTMGFRGEALASIAAVAQVEMLTRREADELGTLIQIDGAKVMDHRPVACPKGTNIAVRNLFFNIPVRRKFLKKTPTELSNIVQDFERMALVYPDIKFTLIHNDTPVFKLDKAGLKQRISDVCGDKLTASLISVQAETPLVKVVGFVGTPETAKRKGARQFFFVNGRFMRHQYFHAAVERAFDNIIPQGEHVNYFIYLQVDPQNIDVNVHPTKTEIKFENEQIIWQVINAMVREAIGRYNQVPSIDFERSDDDIDIPAMPNDGRTVRMTSRFTGYDPFKPMSGRSAGKTNIYDWEKLYPGKDDGASRGHERQEVVLQGALSNQVPKQTELWREESEMPGESGKGGQDLPSEFFQLRDRFIVMPHNDGITVVDQHRAHVAVLFHEYMERMDSHSNVAQGLLFPELIQLSKQEETTLQAAEDEIKAVGFEITSLGFGSYSLTAVPPGLDGTDYAKLLHNLLWAAAENKGSVRQTMGENIALAMAQSAAVSLGQKLSHEEMESLIGKLFRLPNPARTPDGKSVFTVFDNNQIERLF